MGEGDENIRKKLRDWTESIGRGLRVDGAISLGDSLAARARRRKKKE